MRRKGKVHPSPLPSSSSSLLYPSKKDALSVLNLLPAAILAIVSVLSLEDREVFAYMISSSSKATNPSAFLNSKNKKNPNKSTNSHKIPSFDCECFDCYISYWLRWDSSPNRELIHQAIEAFEEHLFNSELGKERKNKKKEKMGRRGITKKSEPDAGNLSPEFQETSFTVDNTPPEILVSPVEVIEECGHSTVDLSESLPGDETAESSSAAAAVQGGGTNSHRGLGRKLLPDVMGWVNSRVWSLWSPSA